MHGAVADVVAIALLVISLGVAVARPFGIDEAVVAVPAAALAVALGVLPLSAAVDELRRIGPTVGFLAAILVFGHLCDQAGVFTYLGARAARASRGDARRLLTITVGLAAVITALLTLDATVVLFTPVVLATTRRLRLPAAPYAFACARVANSGSLVLPVSNLTNLLAFSASGLSFGRFALLMAAPWVVACAAEWATLRVTLRVALGRASAQETASAPGDVPSESAPVFALWVAAATVVGFVVSSSVHVAPAWAASAGCAVLLLPRLRRRELDVRRLVAGASPGFCVFVLALSVLVAAATRRGLGDALARLVPGGSGLLAIVAVAFVAAAAANVVNNLPATLALVPFVAGRPALVLAVLLGVNIGPNLAYPGSLATLLWRRIVPGDERPSAARFHAVGAVTVPVMLIATAGCLWLSVRAFGT